MQFNKVVKALFVANASKVFFNFYNRTMVINYSISLVFTTQPEKKTNRDLKQSQVTQVHEYKTKP